MSYDLEKQRARRAKNPELYREQQRVYRKKHWKELKRKKREYDKEHAAEKRERFQRWWKENREKTLPKKKSWYQRQLAEKKAAVFARYGKRCKKCRIADVRVLCIDHVRGGGSLDRWYGKMSYMQYLDIVAADKTGRYQILCHNCNWIKRRENPNERGGNHSGLLSKQIVESLKKM